MADRHAGGRPTIATDLEPLATPIDKLTLLPGNPRLGDVDAVARSLKATNILPIAESTGREHDFCEVA